MFSEPGSESVPLVKPEMLSPYNGPFELSDLYTHISSKSMSPYRLPVAVNRPHTLFIGDAIHAIGGPDRSSLCCAARSRCMHACLQQQTCMQLMVSLPQNSAEDFLSHAVHQFIASRAAIFDHQNFAEHFSGRPPRRREHLRLPALRHSSHHQPRLLSVSYQNRDRQDCN